MKREQNSRYTAYNGLMRRSRHFMATGTNQKIEIGAEISLHHTFAVQTLITAGR